MFAVKTELLKDFSKYSFLGIYFENKEFFYCLKWRQMFWTILAIFLTGLRWSWGLRCNLLLGEQWRDSPTSVVGSPPPGPALTTLTATYTAQFTVQINFRKTFHSLGNCLPLFLCHFIKLITAPWKNISGYSLY